MSIDPIWFILETGEGLPNSNSYVSFDYANAFHEMMGNVYWNLLDDTVKYNCLVRASAYIDKRFTTRFRGFRMQRDQALAWPRLAAFDDDKYSLTEIPPRLQKTAYDTPAQYRKSTSTQDSRDPQSNVVNDIFIPQYPEADLLIEALLMDGGSITLKRA